VQKPAQPPGPPADDDPAPGFMLREIEGLFAQCGWGGPGNKPRRLVAAAALRAPTDAQAQRLVQMEDLTVAQAQRINTRLSKIIIEFRDQASRRHRLQRMYDAVQEAWSGDGGGQPDPGPAGDAGQGDAGQGDAGQGGQDPGPDPGPAGGLTEAEQKELKQRAGQFNAWFSKIGWSGDPKRADRMLAMAILARPKARPIVALDSTSNLSLEEIRRAMRNWDEWKAKAAERGREWADVLQSLVDGARQAAEGGGGAEA
jgi:hypothetical protein